MRNPGDEDRDEARAASDATVGRPASEVWAEAGRRFFDTHLLERLMSMRSSGHPSGRAWEVLGPEDRLLGMLRVFESVGVRESSHSMLVHGWGPASRGDARFDAGLRWLITEVSRHGAVLAAWFRKPAGTSLVGGLLLVTTERGDTYGCRWADESVFRSWIKRPSFFGVHLVIVDENWRPSDWGVVSPTWPNDWHHRNPSDEDRDEARAFSASPEPRVNDRVDDPWLKRRGRITFAQSDWAMWYVEWNDSPASVGERTVFRRDELVFLGTFDRHGKPASHWKLARPPHSRNPGDEDRDEARASYASPEPHIRVDDRVDDPWEKRHGRITGHSSYAQWRGGETVWYVEWDDSSSSSVIMRHDVRFLGTFDRRGKPASHWKLVHKIPSGNPSDEDRDEARASAGLRTPRPDVVEAAVLAAVKRKPGRVLQPLALVAELGLEPDEDLRAARPSFDEISRALESLHAKGLVDRRGSLVRESLAKAIGSDRVLFAKDGWVVTVKPSGRGGWIDFEAGGRRSSGWIMYGDGSLAYDWPESVPKKVKETLASVLGRWRPATTANPGDEDRDEARASSVGPVKACYDSLVAPLGISEDDFRVVLSVLVRGYRWVENVVKGPRDWAWTCARQATGSDDAYLLAVRTSHRTQSNEQVRDPEVVVGVTVEKWAFRQGERLKISARTSPPGHGLTYPDMLVTASEPGLTGGWDVYEGRNDAGELVSFYGFSVASRTRSRSRFDGHPRDVWPELAEEYGRDFPAYWYSTFEQQFALPTATSSYFEVMPSGDPGAHGCEVRGPDPVHADRPTGMMYRWARRADDDRVTLQVSDVRAYLGLDRNTGLPPGVAENPGDEDRDEARAGAKPPPSFVAPHSPSKGDDVEPRGGAVALNRGDVGRVVGQNAIFCTVCGKHNRWTVRWPDGSATRPCWKGVQGVSPRLWRIV